MELYEKCFLFCRSSQSTYLWCGSEPLTRLISPITLVPTNSAPPPIRTCLGPEVKGFRMCWPPPGRICARCNWHQSRGVPEFLPQSRQFRSRVLVANTSTRPTHLTHWSSHDQQERQNIFSEKRDKYTHNNVGIIVGVMLCFLEFSRTALKAYSYTWSTLALYAFQNLHVVLQMITEINLLKISRCITRRR